MKVLSDAPLVCFDIDNTLVMWDYKYDLIPDKFEYLKINGIDYIIHQKHISQLKKHKNRGHTVILWTQGGVFWAEKVVEALGLEEYVDIVQPKPAWYYDDYPSEHFMGKPEYLQRERYLG